MALSTMKIFRAGGKPFFLNHNCEDDSRHIDNADGGTHVRIDSGLNVTFDDGTDGRMQTEGDTWVLYHGDDRFDTGVSHDHYCWRALMRAEIAVATRYLESALPKVGRPEDSEGGTCD